MPSKHHSYSGPFCHSCKSSINLDLLASTNYICENCHSSFTAVKFNSVKHVEKVQSVDFDPSLKTPCAKHSRNLAVAGCVRCGSFICALCKIDSDGKTLCPQCFDKLSGQGELASTVKKIKNYSGMANICIFCGVILSPVGIMFGSAGIYYCIKGIKDKRKRAEKDGIITLYLKIFINILVIFAGIFVLCAMFD